MLVNLGQARVPYVFVAYDTLGVGDELVAVPFSAFDANRFGTEFVFDEGWDAGVLETSPILDPVALGAEPFDPTWVDEWNTYWEERGVSVTEGE